MKFLFVAILIFSTNLMAENFRVGDVAPTMKVMVGSSDHLDSIAVRDNGKEIFSFKATLVTQKLLQSGLVKFKDQKVPYLVTVWSSGAHGQELIIFDLKKYDPDDQEKAIAYLYGSAWTIDLKVDQEEIKIKGKGSNDEKSGVPVDQNLTFRP